jgi:hypothetical protein
MTFFGISGQLSVNVAAVGLPSSWAQLGWFLEGTLFGTRPAGLRTVPARTTAFVGRLAGNLWALLFSKKQPETFSRQPAANGGGIQWREKVLTGLS